MPAQEANRLVGGPGALLVIDDIALPEKDELSVGMARQCYGQLGRKANYQPLVSLKEKRDSCEYAQPVTISQS